MANSLKRASWLASLLALLGVSWSALLLGCGQQNAASQEKPTTPPTVQVAPAPTAVPAPTATPALTATLLPPSDRLHQPFQEATSDETPEGQGLPESGRTKAGHRENKEGPSIGKLFETVVSSWDQIKFVSPAGKRLAYTATLKTDLGTVTIELWPDVAPNHVRNFVALVRAGYYNGLEFDLTYNDTTKEQFLPGIVGGCPECTGEVGLGSIGYWMIPELSDTVKHEAGTVGAWHDPEQVDTGACKFYISLNKAPVMDAGDYSVFGKVTQGLDVVRTIWGRPVEQNELKNRPEQPVVIRAATIDCREVETVQPK